MPSKLTDVPSTFQVLVNEVFRPYLRKFILVFFDGILVYSKTKEKHLNNLKTILKTLTFLKLYVKISKCKFLYEKIENLRHIVSKKKVKANPSKVQIMLK
jgi:hypothetical protein